MQLYEIRAEKAKYEVWGIDKKAWNKQLANTVQIAARHPQVDDILILRDVKYVLPLRECQFVDSFEYLPYEVWEIHDQYKRRIM